MPQASPGLKHLRDFVNTWHVPHETRQAVDELVDVDGTVRSTWLQPELTQGGSKISQKVIDLRNDLRKAIENPEQVSEYLNPWIENAPVQFSLEMIETTPRIKITATDDEIVGSISSIIIDEILKNQFSRLKCCPDCRACFIDDSKNLSRRWCGMDKGTPNGRACGTISKVGRFRERQKALLKGGEDI